MIGEEIFGWKVTKFLGEGCCGSVYKVEKSKEKKRKERYLRESGRSEEFSLEDDQEFALKCIPKHPEWFQLFGELILKDHEINHDNIIKLYDDMIFMDTDGTNRPSPFGERMNMVGLRMELCDSDLHKYLENRKIVDQNFNKDIFLQILNGLKHLHSFNITHRDLKPSNIMLKSGVTKIADFGLAKVIDDNQLATHSQKGTPIYLAPEVLTGNYNKNVDIYSLGIILMQLFIPNNIFINWVQGQIPQLNVWAKQLENKEILNINDINFNKSIPEASLSNGTLSNLIKRMISRPDERPSIEEIKEQFNQSIQSIPSINPFSQFLQSILFTKKCTSSTELKNPKTILSSNQKGKLLCLDGGGIRGLIEAKMLDHFEKKTERKISDLFEWIAGTSTGGLLALYIGLGHSAEECRELYNNLKDVIFGSADYKAIESCLKTGQQLEPIQGNISSHTDRYEALLKSFFGDKKMKDIRNLKVIITVTQSDTDPMKLRLFTNYDPDTNNTFIWQVARATSAAPNYFRNFFINGSGPFIDGGLTANNPTLAALTEITNYNFNIYGQHFLSTTVSLGTGLNQPKKARLPDLPTCSGNWKYLQLIKIGVKIGFNLMFSENENDTEKPESLDMLISELTRSDGHIVEYARTSCRLGNINYHRFNPQLNKPIKLNEINQVILDEMLQITDDYIQSNQQKFEECINQLMSLNQ